MKPITTAILATLAISMVASAAPRLVISTPSLTPESQIDLVFDSPVTAISDLGKTVDNTWIEIQPELPGKLLWKSQNMATFIPDKSPALGTKYTFSISENHHHLDGTPVPTGEFATSESEAFRIITANAPNRWRDDYTLSTSEWLIVFNDAVDPATITNHIFFGSKNGKRISAKLVRATAGQAGYYGGNTKPWAARFPGNQVTEIKPETPLEHVLLASPVTPLPVDDGWSLGVFRGLVNSLASARTLEDYTYSIGDVKPFKVADIGAYQNPDEPRKIQISFNQPVPASLPVDFLTKCIEMNPRPENLSATVDGKIITLEGDFNDLKKCTVTFRPPYTSAAGLDLVGALTKEIKFGNFIPVLSFPSQDQAQLSKGSRTYRMLALNLESAHLRIKKLTGADQIRAFQGYRHVTGNGPDHQSVEPTIPTIPYSLIVGEPVVDQEIQFETPIDTTKVVSLKWDDILPKDQRTGTFFVEASGTVLSTYEGRGTAPTTQAIIQLTDIGLAWKLTAGDAYIYAFSCDTGAALPGVKVEIFGEDAIAMQSATTDAAGIATLPRGDGARHLRASLGDDNYLTAFDSSLETVGLWHFPIRYSWNKSAAPVRKAFLFTDRSLYRPGETARMKGIVRNQHGNAVEHSEASPARIVVLDPTDKEIHTSPVTLSENGSFDFTYQIPEGKVGSYSIRLEYPEELAKAEALEDDWDTQEAINESARFSLPLRVEEFRRNAFEITQTIAPPAPGVSSVAVDLTAKYYQGQPVAGGSVKHFSRVTASNPYPERFRDYLFGNHRVDDWSYWYHYFGYRQDDESSGNQATQIQGETQLTADGKASITTQIPQAEFPTARELTISSEITDANNQTLTSTSTTTIHPASVYVGVSRNDKLIRAGDTVPLKLVATDTQGEPFPEVVKVTATLSREVNTAVKSRTDTGATTTRNDVSEENVTTSEITLEPSASAGQGHVFNITPKSNGRHFLTVSGTDPEGRKFSTITYFTVYGTDEYPWLYEDGLRVKLVAEKKSYKPGETARVLVLSPIEGTALVTVEREKVLRSFQVQLKADNPVIEIPLTDDDAPNAYVSVLIVKGAKESAREHKEPQLRLGYCELMVENLRDQLAVSISEPEKSYRPGDEITLTGSIRLASGAPAAGAEVTLYAEDEGTLAVMGYETPHPFDYFYAPRTLDVETGTSFQTFISEDPAQQVFHNKGFFIGGGGDMSKLTDLMRKNFDPCATWAPTIRADAAGKFSHRFTVPDTLTRYRVIAIAHQQAARFGHAESGIIVKKDLMLEPKTPRFANQSDTFNPQVLVQNASEYAGTWEIRFSTGGGAETPCVVATGITVETVTLDPGASTTVVFPVRAESTGEAVLSWTATPVSINGGQLTELVRHQLSDAVEARLPVHYPMPLLRQTKLVNLSKPGVKQNLRDLLDANLLDGSGSIELGFSRSPLVEAAGSIDYLLSYPHGCVEQTTSSLMPWLAVEDLKPIVPRFAEIPEKKVQAAIQAGADRLLSMQLADGSFGYWPGATESVPWATAYAGLGLIMAAEKGASVPESATAALVGNLKQSLRGIAEEKSPSVLETHTRALLVLALVGEPETAYRNVLVDRVADLTPSARYLLATAIAMEDEGNEENLAVAKSLITSPIPFGAKDDDWMRYSASEAYRLIAWLAVEPDGQEPSRALDRMLHERNPYGQWQTTWVNGWSLMAMAGYAAHENLEDKPVTLAFESGKGAETISLTKENPVATRSSALSPELKLDLTSEQGGFVRMNVAAKPKIVPIQPVSNNGLSIDRVYERIHGDGAAEILTEPQVGDLIRVTLRVTLPTDDTRYLVIEDPLPSLFETVNTDFKSQSAAIGTPTSETDWNVSHSELRTDRAVFYLNQIWRKGTYTLTYLARCTVSGQATAPPAKVESMYDPENFALSASRVFTTK